MITKSTVRNGTTDSTGVIDGNSAHTLTRTTTMIMTTFMMIAIMTTVMAMVAVAVIAIIVTLS